MGVYSSTWERNLCAKYGQVLSAACGCLGRREYERDGVFTFSAGSAWPACIFVLFYKPATLCSTE